jgi:thymidine kinase
MLPTPRDTGWIEVICGPMFSGKTEELIRRLTRARIARQRVQVFKPRVDTRSGDEQILSHSARSLVSIPVDSPDELLERVAPDTQVVGIDEVQFLGPGIVAACETLANRGVRVIVAGLDQDYRGRPFEPMPSLLASAEFISKELAICVVCGNPAGRSQRLSAARSQVAVGGMGDYEPRCRRCYVPEAEPTTEDLQSSLFPSGRDHA